MQRLIRSLLNPGFGLGPLKFSVFMLVHLVLKIVLHKFQDSFYFIVVSVVFHYEVGKRGLYSFFLIGAGAFCILIVEIFQLCVFLL